MSISLFMTFDDPVAGDWVGRRIEPDDLARIVGMVGSVSGMSEGLVFTPPERRVNHMFMNDGTAPVLALQLRFPDLFVCEAAIERESVLAELAAGRGLPSLSGLEVTHQAMLTRPFPVDVPQHPPGVSNPCSFLVHYPGPADDLNAWHLHYNEHHPAIMRTFPGIRQIEIFTRVDWVDRLPSRRVEYMQRNKVVFDSPEALADALSSDIIKTMRADFHKFPAFSGGNKHFPMLTRPVKLR